MNKLTEPKNLKKEISLHFIVDGKFLEEHSRSLYWFEDREDHAVKLLAEGLQGITAEQVKKIINGDAVLNGSSICSRKDCEQCVGLDPITYTEKEDKKFKLEITKRILWLNEACYKIGQYHIEKKLINDYLGEVAHYEHMLSRDHEVDYLEESVKIHRKSLWTVTGHGLPSMDYIPEKGSIDYDFTKLMNDFVHSTERRMHQAGFGAEDLIEKIQGEITVIKKPLESKVNLKPTRAEGSTLITVPDPENKYKEKTFNVPKEQLLSYLNERNRHEREMKFTMNLDIDKEKVLKRYKNLQKIIGQRHTLLMESMNLRHIDSGIYSKGMVEYFVNEAVQYFVLNTIFWKEGSVDRLPNEIRLKISKNKGYVDIYVDGKLEKEKETLR